MINRGLPLVLLLVLAGCSASRLPTPTPRAGYNEVGNGGVPIRILFELGRFQAGQIVRRITNDGFPTHLEQQLDSYELSWIRSSKNRLDLANYLDKSDAGHQAWVDHLPTYCRQSAMDSCGCHRPGEKIYFAQSYCESTVKTAHQAALLWVHEALHEFFNDDEAKVRSLGAAFFTIWANMGHPETSHWKRLPPLPVTDNKALPSRAVWTGSKLMVFVGSNLFLFDPINDIWEKENNQNTEESVLPHQWDLLAPREVVWTDHYAVACDIVSDLLSGETLMPGMVYDIKLHRWSAMAQQRGLEFCAKVPSVSIGKSLLFLPEANTTEVGPASSTFYRGNNLYTPGTNSWTPISTLGEPSARLGFAAVWTGKNAIVWGGWDPSGYPLNDGAIYDPAIDRWKSISLKNAPSGRGRAIAVWTRNEMLVYGGASKKDEFYSGGRKERQELLNGAAYNPELDQWRLIADGFIATERTDDSLTAHWTGSHLLIENFRQLSLYSPFLNQWGDPIDSSYYLPIEPRPSNRFFGPAYLSSFWTGMELIIWDNFANRGFAFYPQE